MPQAPAPFEIAVFSLSIRAVAATPPNRWKQPRWQVIQASMSFDRAQTMVFYCHRGSRSQQAASHVLKMGFKDVHNLQGGIDAWSVHIDEDVARY